MLDIYRYRWTASDYYIFIVRAGIVLGVNAYHRSNQTPVSVHKCHRPTRHNQTLRDLPVEYGSQYQSFADEGQSKTVARPPLEDQLFDCRRVVESPSSGRTYNQPTYALQRRDEEL